MDDTAKIAKSIKVLVVDDTATNRQILQVFLQRLGFGVVLAEDGAEAVEKFSSERPDIVLMDVMMPVLDGFEATRRIKALCGDRWVPVVFLTALDKEEDLVTGLDAGGDDYLTKPISFVVLDAKLRSLLRTLSLQRALEETRRRTQAITDNIVDGVITIDERGIIRSCNPMVTTIFGYAPGEMLGRDINMLMPEPQQKLHDGYIDAYLSGRPAKVLGTTRKMIGRRQDGAEIPIEIAVSEVRLAAERLFVGIVRDISERVAVEARLRDNAMRLQRYHDMQEQENALAHTIMQRVTLREGMQDPQVQHWIRPAVNFSGDILAAARSPQGRLYALLGDATGHGLAAAISALPAATVFYGMIKRDLPLSVIVAELNRHLRDTLPEGRFLAASLFCADPGDHHAEVWIGGMPEALLIDADGKVVRRFSATQMALGILDFDAEMCATESIQVTPSSQFVFYSDGLVEADDGEGHGFGHERLETTLASAPPELRLDAIKLALGLHSGQAEPHDDISVMLISCT